MISKLIDAVDLIAGYAFKSGDFGNYPDKVIKITQINPPIVDLKSATGINLQKYNRSKLEKYIAKKGDFVLAMTGATIGKIGRIEEGEPYINQRVLMFKPKSNVDSDFIYYVLQSYEFLQYVLNHIDSESAQPNISANTIGNFEFELPDLILQKKIGALLRNLDEKAELNRRINDNLSKQITSYFIHLFIDNEESSNWEAKSISSLVEDTLGGDWGKDSPTGNNTEMVYCIRGADIPDIKFGNKGKMPIRYILPKNYAAKKLHNGDLVVEISGGSPTQSTGRVAFISESLLKRFDKGLVCTNFCRAVKPKPGWSMFLYTLWQYLYDKDLFFIYENGTTGIKNFDLNGFLVKEQISIPPKELLEKFNQLCTTSFDMIFKNGLENEKLSNLRDLLLPKLMSGEIDVDSIGM